MTEADFYETWPHIGCKNFNPGLVAVLAAPSQYSQLRVVGVIYPSACGPKGHGSGAVLYIYMTVFSSSPAKPCGFLPA